MTDTAIKERPILFSAPMVRAILDGSKVQTRRLIKPQFKSLLQWDGAELLTERITRKGRQVIRCPYGVAGDRLWVRESGWQSPDDGTDFDWEYDANKPDVDSLKAAGWIRRPSIHMPRTASRITLEVTGVRVERINDISESDAFAEGVTLPEPVLEAYYSGFKRLWVSINGPQSWDENPWVWVVEFRKLEQPA